jgi:hypothetical protein
VSFVSDAKPIVAPGDPRTMVFRLVNFHVRRPEEEMLRAPEIAWKTGCYGLERGPEGTWRWCEGKGELALQNPGTSPARMLLSARLKTGYPQRSTITFGGDVLAGAVAVSSRGTLFEKEVVVPPGQHLIKFHADAKRVSAPGDPRDMVFRFENPRLERMP